MNKETYMKLKFNILSFSLFIIFLIITIGAGFQAVMFFLEMRSFESPGKLIPMDGYSLHINCTGTGSITILLESDLGFPAMQWQKIQDVLSKETQVCSYDRGGLGWSDQSPVPREGQQMVEELYRLLRKNNINNPFIIVGSGYGSLLARLFADQYPESSLGLVLLDPEPVNNILSDRDNTLQSLNVLRLRVTALTTWLGITRIGGAFGEVHEYQAPIANYPTEFQREFLAITAYRTDHWPAVVNELLSLDQIKSEIKSQTRTSQIPVLVLVDDSRLENINSTNAENYKQINVEDLREQMAFYTNINFDICSECGGMPSLTDPNSVIAIIQNVYDQIKP